MQQFPKGCERVKGSALQTTFRLLLLYEATRPPLTNFSIQTTTHRALEIRAASAALLARIEEIQHWTNGWYDAVDDSKNTPQLLAGNHRLQLPTYSDSSTAASTRKSKNPTAMPTRTKALMIGMTRIISAPASQVEAAAPPLEAPLPKAWHLACIREKSSSVLEACPIVVTLLSAFRPPKLLSPCTLATGMRPLVLLWQVAEATDRAAGAA
eukprot:TRINITY_DN8250_c0_g1_i1.p1 TRINITY_DN8250_c0_g1~~TRINITY_DN8250_c0_g1_i1.p1  ORF type:complete len:211 (-),score=15.18 TRINITY_DN8250_c0_g1_i1:213-845(-)